MYHVGRDYDQASGVWDITLQAVTSSGTLTGGKVIYDLNISSPNLTTVFYYNGRLYYKDSGQRFKYIPIALPLTSAALTPVNVTGPVGLTRLRILPDTRRLVGWSSSGFIFYNATDGSDSSVIIGGLPDGMTFEPDLNTIEFDSHVAAGTTDLGYRVTDGNGDTALGTVRVTVNAVAYPDITFTGSTSYT